MKKTVFLLLIFLCIKGLAFGYTLPVPPDTAKEDEQKVSLNNIPYTTERYVSRLSAQELTSFYKENLPRQGFALTAEDEKANVLYFFNAALKENLAIAIDDSQAKEVIMDVSSWQGDLPQPEGAPTQEPFLVKEVPGGDLAGVPRYPGSIRISALSSSGMKNASYTTADEKEKVLRFYESQMPAAGWKNPGIERIAKEKAAELLGGKTGIAQSGYLFFENKDSFCGIMIQDACCGLKGTMIGMLLLPKNIPGMAKERD